MGEDLKNISEKNKKLKELSKLSNWIAPPYNLNKEERKLLKQFKKEISNSFKKQKLSKEEIKLYTFLYSDRLEKFMIMIKMKIEMNKTMKMLKKSYSKTKIKKSVKDN